MFSNILQSSTLRVFLISNFGNFFSFLYVIYISKVLKVGDFSLITSSISLIGMLTLVSSFFVPIISQQVSSNYNKYIKKFYISSIFKFSVIFLFIGIIFYILKDFFFNTLKFDSELFLILLILIFFLNSLLNLNDGFILGARMYKVHAFSNLIQHSLRLITVVILLSFLKDLNLILFAFVLSLIICNFFLVSKLKNYQYFSGTGQILEKNINALSKKFFIIIMISITTYTFLNLDAVYARKLFTEDTSGYYIAVAILGKISFYLLVAIIPIIIPKTSFESVNNFNTKMYIVKLLLVIFSYLILSSIIFLFFKDLILSLMFSPEYVKLSSLIFLTNLNFVFLSASIVLMNYLFAINFYKPIIISFLISIIFFPMIYFIELPLDLIKICLFLNLLIFFNLIIHFYRLKKL